MLEDASALGDLALVLGWAVAFALSSLAFYLAKAIAGPLNVSILGTHPFRGIQTAIENGIIEPLADVRAKSDAEIARGLRGLLNSLELFAGLTLLALVGIRDALGYGWHAVIRPLIVQLADEAAKLTDRLAAEVRRLEEAITHAISRAAAYTDAEIAQAAVAFQSYADEVARVAAHEAEAYADDAVSRLRAAEDAAVADAVRLAEDARAAGEAAAAHALRTAEAGIASLRTEAERLATQATATAEAEAARALAAADAAGKAALATVKSIAIGAETEINDLAGPAGLVGAAALIAAIPAISTLVHAIATEAGLSDASCRSKVGNICSTNPARWGELLAGLGLVGVGFSLHEIVDAASAVVHDTAPLIADLAA